MDTLDRSDVCFQKCLLRSEFWTSIVDYLPSLSCWKFVSDTRDVINFQKVTLGREKCTIKHAGLLLSLQPLLSCLY